MLKKKKVNLFLIAERMECYETEESLMLNLNLK